jgi:DNA topoisomerase IA
MTAYHNPLHELISSIYFIISSKINLQHADQVLLYTIVTTKFTARLVFKNIAFNTSVTIRFKRLQCHWKLLPDDDWTLQYLHHAQSTSKTTPQNQDLPHHCISDEVSK